MAMSLGGTTSATLHRRQLAAVSRHCLHHHATPSTAGPSDTRAPRRTCVHCGKRNTHPSILSSLRSFYRLRARADRVCFVRNASRAARRNNFCLPRKAAQNDIASLLALRSPSIRSRCYSSPRGGGGTSRGLKARIVYHASDTCFIETATYGGV